MDTTSEVIQMIGSVLQLRDGGASLRPDSGLLGAVPEFDSMAVVAVITALEERFGFAIDDDEIEAETFRTVGTLTAFVDRKLTG